MGNQKRGKTAPESRGNSVWILTSGFYLNIEGVFSTRELAEKAAQCLDDANEPFEMTVDRHAKKLLQGKKPYMIWMDRDGNVESTSWFSFQDDLEPFLIFDENKWIRFVSWEKSAEHAIKICNEKRVEAIARGLL